MESEYLVTKGFQKRMPPFQQYISTANRMVYDWFFEKYLELADATEEDMILDLFSKNSPRVIGDYVYADFFRRCDDDTLASFSRCLLRYERQDHMADLPQNELIDKLFSFAPLLIQLGWKTAGEFLDGEQGKRPRGDRYGCRGTGRSQCDLGQAGEDTVPPPTNSPEESGATLRCSEEIGDGTGKAC